MHPGDIMVKFTGPEDRIVRVNDGVNDRVNDRVNDQEKALLNHLAQDPGYTVKQLAEIMNVSRKTIAGYLKNLKDKGIIERIGSSRNGYRKIKTSPRPAGGSFFSHINPFIFCTSSATKLSSAPT